MVAFHFQRISRYSTQHKAVWASQPQRSWRSVLSSSRMPVLKKPHKPAWMCSWLSGGQSALSSLTRRDPPPLGAWRPALRRPTVRLSSSEWANRLGESQRRYCAGSRGMMQKQRLRYVCAVLAKTNGDIHYSSWSPTGGLRWGQQEPPALCLPTCVDIILFMGIVDNGWGRMRIPVAGSDSFL